jgi:CheY-like chemotaxis protein
MSHLPHLMDALPAGELTTCAPSSGARTQSINACPKSALLVEGDDALSNFFRTFLSKEGYAVRIASNALEGLRLYRDCAPYTVVLIDYCLPRAEGMGVDWSGESQSHGVELALAIRNLNPSQGVILAAFAFRSAGEISRPPALTHIPIIVETNVSQLRMVLEKIEVDRAIKALTRPDQLRLQYFAKYRIRGLGRAARDRDWEDLLEEALYRTLIGATEARQGRHWNKKVDLVKHLEQAMRSIANSWKRQFKDEGTFLISELSRCDANGQEYSPLDSLICEHATADEQLIEEEDLALLFASLKDDQQATEVLQGWLHGLRKDEILSKYGFDRKQYLAIIRRIRVKLSKPGNHSATRNHNHAGE